MSETKKWVDVARKLTKLIKQGITKFTIMVEPTKLIHELLIRTATKLTVTIHLHRFKPICVMKGKYE